MVFFAVDHYFSDIVAFIDRWRDSRAIRALFIPFILVEKVHVV
jgi:hypothetical protein